jgi:L-alanine-DL-glutamate epimerase-like enolase superfamily enzyme
VRAGWVEPACWDVVGKARGKPVWALLGGKPGKVKLYASSGSVRTGTARVQEVNDRLAEGFEAVKLRVHAATLDEDVQQLRETRRAVGDRPVLAVDANQGWRVAAVADAPLWDLARATAFCRTAEELGFAWVEEPLAMDDLEGLARLRGDVGIDVAGGELNGGGVATFQAMLDKGCLDVYQPDAVMVGGIAETWRIVQRVRAAGMRYTPHTWTNGIGFAVNLQLMGASPFREDMLLEYPLDPPGWTVEGRDGVLARPWIHDRGTLELPSAPGLGIELDERALRRFGKRFYRGDKVRVAVTTVLDRGLSAAAETKRERDARLARRHAELASSGSDPALAALEG